LAYLSLKVTQGERPRIPPKTPQEWVDFIVCWAQEASRRPEMQHIVDNADEWLKFEGCDEAEWNKYKQQVLLFQKKGK
jgi:hypothetical protein